MHYRISRGIYVVGGGELSSLADNNVYLITMNNEKLLLYDSGSPWGVIAVIRNIMELGFSPRKIEYVVISHAHIESAGGASTLYWINNNVKTIAHEPDSTMIRQGDPLYTNSCVYNVDFPSYPITISLSMSIKEYNVVERPLIKLFHTPGHTKGLITLVYEDSDERIAFISDALGPLCSSWLSDDRDFMETLDFLQKMDCTKYCSSTKCYSRKEFNALVETIMEKGVDALRVKCCSKKYG
ncbi:MBL fold metallo-hydrolase [Desulfurococcaceae archaeon MEX13E-LK6-19]|nr:MBL fold metallo-hydrolase [Desulfurococcaceae archaeon MEX13E-LK6-19]